MPSMGEPTILVVNHPLISDPGLFRPIVENRGYAIEEVDYSLDQRPARPIGEYAAMVVMGGSPQVDEEDKHPWLVTEKAAIREAVDNGTPYLGVCFGAQLLADVAGGVVRPATVPRHGWGDVVRCGGADGDPVFGGLPTVFRTVVWQHYEIECPPNATQMARSATALHGFRIDGKPAWGTQFHPEAGPVEIRSWIDSLNSVDEITSDAAELVLAEAEVYHRQQLLLSDTICGAFLRVVDERSNASQLRLGASNCELSIDD
ncbi:type 1 glutamine amidotransferase [Mycolicibacterium confluentis]|nr:type 1 glutamine amidotransferase [Mycolicibacterium confluentis]MCV7320604.1 type 1 glutamine amidotransferase [Mycolicibacterium confluentis]